MKKLLLLSLLIGLNVLMVNPAHAGTLTVYPDASPETTSVDGGAERSVGSENFATIRAGAGTGSSDSATTADVQIISQFGADAFTDLKRAIVLFDTSSIGSGVVISDATLSFTGQNALSTAGQTPLHVAASSPASNTAVANADYGNVSTTSFGSIAFSSFNFNATTYNDISLNSSGLANIDGSGISKFSAQLEWDINNSYTGSDSSSDTTRYQLLMAENTGTTKDPKLVVNYSSAFTSKLIIIQ